MGRTSQSKVLAALKSQIIDESERLQSLDEFRLLTDKQKQMCFEHVHHPELTKSEIAQKMGIGKATVYNFFHSKTWETINNELARQQLRELVQLSVKTLRLAMTTGTAPVRLEAATRVLVNAEILRPSHARSITKTDNKMIVVWNEAEDKKAINAVETEKIEKIAEITPGNQDPVPAA